MTVDFIAAENAYPQYTYHQIDLDHFQNNRLILKSNNCYYIIKMINY